MTFPETVQLSPNFDRQPSHGRKGVLIHHTVMSFSDTLAYMLKPESKVSYHTVIARTGERCRLVEDEHIAWHAGVSTFQGQQQCNSFLLGLAFEGDTYREPLTELQLDSAREWLESRWIRYSLSTNWVVDHRQVAPGRKDDLNPTEWQRFHAHLVSWVAGLERGQS